MPLVLVEDVVDDLLLGVAHQVVVLAALAQVHFGAVVATVVHLFGAHAASGKGWREVAAHLHLVDKRMLFAVADFQADAVVGRVGLGDHVQALLDKHGGHFFNRRADRGFEEAVDLVP